MEQHMPENIPYFSEGCLYTKLQNGIHLVVLKQATRQACDECFEQVALIYQKALPKKPLLIAIDLRSTELPPMLYIARHVARLRGLFPQQTPRKVAFLYSQILMSPVVHLLMILMMFPRRKELRLFTSAQWDEASLWLLRFWQS